MRTLAMTAVALTFLISPASSDGFADVGADPGGSGQIVVYAGASARGEMINDEERKTAFLDEETQGFHVKKSADGSFVSTEEMRGILAEKSHTVFDSRPPSEFISGHIPGAINLSDIVRVTNLVGNKQSMILLYCDGASCVKSARLSDELLAAGYTHVRRYELPGNFENIDAALK
jgi:rhodanese-related sulfurtransferase